LSRVKSPAVGPLPRPEFKGTAAEIRNYNRVRARDEADANIICKYLPPNIASIFDPPCVSIDKDDFVPSAWLHESIDRIAKELVPVPKKPPFKFDRSRAARAFNTELLLDHDYDLSQILEKSQDTTLAYGSEFRPLADLVCIFGKHPNYDFFADIHKHGVDYHFEFELTESERMAELQANLQRGNHSSAKEDEVELLRLAYKEVDHGFAIPIDRSAVHEIKGAAVQAVGIVSQYTITSTGERKLKKRLTHDLSYWITKFYASINARCNMKMYPPMVYGWCLIRIIHYIIALRLAFPTKRILISKYDFSDAYRRIAHAAKAAAQTILVIGEVAFICLRLSFGGSVNPPSWCSVSEMITDLSNELPLIAKWDPDQLFSPAQVTVPSPKYLDDSIPLALARPLAVDIPTTALGRGDCFVDDIIKVYIDDPVQIKRHAASAPLAIHIAMRPNAGEKEPITRREALSEAKLEAEGTPAEIQAVLGWDLDTRRLICALPEDKYRAWCEEIKAITIRESKIVTRAELESVIGRLTHASWVVPLSRHFLSKLRYRLKGVRHRNQTFRLSQEDLDDLALWLDFLHMAREGISLNGLTMRNPTILSISDSCPLGLGGFTSNGRAWRLKVSSDSFIYGKSISNNILEFLAMAITIWLALLECEASGKIEELILALGDNTSAIGWLHKTGKLPKSSPYYKAANFIARKVATLLSKSKNFLAAQHIPGKENEIADWLTFEGKDRSKEKNAVAHLVASDCPSNEQLTNRLLRFCPQLIPQHFEISHLPTEIFSFAQASVQMLESSMIQNLRDAQKLVTGSGDGGLASAKPLPTSQIPILSEYLQVKSPRSSEPFSSYIENHPSRQRGSFTEAIKHRWQDRLSEVPQGLWERSSGTISGGHLCTVGPVKTKKPLRRKSMIS
jgi:hypothetical protein